MAVERVGIALDPELRRQLDRLVRSRGYTNRSEAIRDFVRAELVREQWETGENEVVGVLSFVYDHTSMEVADRILEAEHHELPHIISSLHIHLDKRHCLEVIVLRGKPADLRRARGKILSLRGVKHGALVETTTGKSL